MKNITLVLLIAFFSIFVNAPLFAQETGEIEKTEREIQKEKLLRERIEKEKKEPEVEEKLPKEAPPALPTEKILIQKINVTGVTLISEKEIKNIILPFQNQELTLSQLQKAADLITDAYRQKGFITSRAYLPPQKIEEGILEIRVIEGLTGEIKIKGNRYFKASLLKKRITLRKGEPFNYNILRGNLSKINRHPDRTSRVVLMPGKEPGTTDMLLEVKDRLPIHIGFDWDNFGSRYIEKDRYQLSLTHNNLLGFDDILTLQYQLAEADAYRLTALRYLFPITDSSEIGFLVYRTKLDLGREYKDLNLRGKSEIYSIYFQQYLIEEENIDLSLNLGFDYKDVLNFQLDNESSRDRLRIVKLGFDLDVADNFGRTILTNEIGFGIPNIMGGLKEHDSSEQGAAASKGHGGSRAGSGGKFIKDTINLLRLQKMPFSSTLLWKNQIQLSPYILTATEQFQIGGIANVRGYPPAEFVGDKGYSMSWEWSFPVYPFPRTIKFPLSQAKLYDALRVATFYDWGNVQLRRPQAGEEKNKTLRGAGWGLRFNLPEDFSLRLDFAWPLDNTPSDNNHFHPWVQVSKSF